MKIHGHVRSDLDAQGGARARQSSRGYGLYFTYRCEFKNKDLNHQAGKLIYTNQEEYPGSEHRWHSIDFIT